MKYEVIMEKGDYALILRGSRMKEYAIVNRLDKAKDSWAWTCCYVNFGEFAPCNQAQALASCVDYFRSKTESDYIPRCRLEELATLFKDGLISDDRESAMEYFNEVCEMTEEEKEWFGIEEDSPIANTKFENPMYNKGYDDGFSDAMNDKED